MTYPFKVKVRKCRVHPLVVLTGSFVVTVMLRDGYGVWVTRERYSFKDRLSPVFLRSVYLFFLDPN